MKYKLKQWADWWSASHNVPGGLLVTYCGLWVVLTLAVFTLFLYYRRVNIDERIIRHYEQQTNHMKGRP